MTSQNHSLPVDLATFRTELESKKYAWYFVAGALDFMSKGKPAVDMVKEQADRENEDLKGLLEVVINHHIKEFTPPGWVEPIRVPIGYVDYELCGFVADKIMQILKD